MVRKAFLISALAASISFVFAESNVIKLDPQNFATEVLEKDLVMVKFYTPKCAGCISFAPEYEEAATQLKGYVNLTEMDCSVYSGICQHYEVDGYPTVKIFRKGEGVHYEGLREAAPIVKLLKSEARPALQEVTEETFDEFVDSEKLVFVGYVDDAASLKTLQEMSMELQKSFPFGIVKDRDLAKQHNVQFPSLVLYKKYDEGRNDLLGPITSLQDIRNFIKEHGRPLIQPINSYNLKYYITAGKPLGFIFHETDEQRDELTETIYPLAKKYKDKLNIVQIDAKLYGSHAKNIALREEKWPAFGIQSLEAGTKYPFDQSAELTYENLRAFVDSVMGGTAVPTLRTADPPAENNGPLKTVVASQWQEILMDPATDAIVLVCVEFSKPCRPLNTIWNTLAELVAEQDPSIVVGFMDGEENDVPTESGYRLEEFPAIVFYKAGTNKLVEFNGDHNIEALAAFIEKNSAKKTKLVIPAEETEETEEANPDRDEL